MILADKIIEERKKNGWSQEELAEKLGVSRQAVSKWESAGSMPDLQRIIQMAELFGVSTDYLLREDMVQEEVSVYTDTGNYSSGPVRRVSMEDAHVFLDMKKKSAPVIANAVFMCIISPVLLILLSCMSEEPMFHISENFAAGVGVVFLLAVIAAAVFLFITNGIKESHMEHLEKECFETEYGVTGMVKERSRSFEPVYTRGLAIGVVLCIISVVPLFIAAALEAPDYICGIFVCVLLVIIACGVNLIIRVSMIKGSYDTLLQEGEFSKEEKKAKKKLGALSSAYWCLATAIYLGWSFWTMQWNLTWIVWPVAGVLYAAVSGIMRMIVGVE
ncbi:MAG: helix-turn-helix domain-containing protein [Lachnospiraceae bacterium]